MLVDKAPIITQDDGVQPEILRATAVEEQPVIDLSRKEKACVCLLIYIYIFPAELCLASWLPALLLVTEYTLF